jgi:DNA polymerase elongation subunit (family B)/predicted RNA-binding Zn-ribbon protein involved in translation (DUF1610 family)
VSRLADHVQSVRILTLDIETSPNLAHVWGLWGQNVSLSQLQETGQVIAFAAKWYGEKKVIFRSDHHDGHDAMVREAHRLLSEADIVVHYNGKRFDIPHLQREFVLAGLAPAKPFKQVDLLQVVKQQFRFVSNKLDHVVQQLGLGAKVSHTGHEMWVKCMAGDPEAWALMRKYNIGDIKVTEKLYDRLRPWIPNHPNLGLWSESEKPTCPNCGSTKRRKADLARTALTAYAQYQCKGCGTFLRANHVKGRVTLRQVR